VSILELRKLLLSLAAFWNIALFIVLKSVEEDSYSGKKLRSNKKPTVVKLEKIKKASFGNKACSLNQQSALPTSSTRRGSDQ